MTTPSKSATPADRHCLRCGKTAKRVTFRSESALKCEKCDEVTATERREYHRLYHAARARAIKTLIDRYDGEYRQYLAKETKGLVQPSSD